jgi:hypothetical protein
MIKAVARRSDGRKLVILGLSHNELDSLKEGEKFWFVGEAFGADGLDFTISAGSREDLLRDINENLVQPQTVVKMIEPS